jgi:uncharacterized cupin superfamily protein
MTNPRKPAQILRADEIRERRRLVGHDWNPKSRFRGTAVTRLGGLERCFASVAWLEPGDESFCYHAHEREEEWLYIIAGRAVAEIDGQKLEVGPGDFLAFPVPSVAHNLGNPFSEPCMYLMGGDNQSLEIIDYPRMGRRVLLESRPGQRTLFHTLDAGETPFGAR